MNPMNERYLKAVARCQCGITGVRLYRESGFFRPGDQSWCGRCAGPLAEHSEDQRQNGDNFYLPLVLSARGHAWGYTSVDKKDGAV